MESGGSTRQFTSWMLSWLHGVVSRPRPGSNCGNGQRYGGRVTDTARRRWSWSLSAEGVGTEFRLGFSSGTVALERRFNARPPVLWPAGRRAVQCFASPAWVASAKTCCLHCGGKFEPAMDGREEINSTTTLWQYAQVALKV